MTANTYTESSATQAGEVTERGSRAGQPSPERLGQENVVSDKKKKVTFGFPLN